MKSKTKDTFIELKDNKLRPFLNDRGEVLTDKEFAKMAVKAIDDYTKAEKKLPPIEPVFVSWLKEFTQEVGEEVTAKEFKEKSIVKSFGGDYSVLSNIAK